MAKFEVVCPDRETKPNMRGDLHVVEVEGVEELNVIGFNDQSESEGSVTENFAIVEFLDTDEKVVGVALLQPGQVIRKKL